MTGTELKKMKKIIDNFTNKKILVLGDLMLDKYIWGNVARISPEAPVPVVEVHKDSSCLGGAGNAANSLESLGASPLLVGVVGDDGEGQWIKENVPDSRSVFTDTSRPTTVKTRIIAHHQQVVRVDLEKKSPISAKMEKQIIKFIKEESFDGILISDYNKGTLSRSLVSQTLSYAKRKKIPVFVDPKLENFFHYSPVTLITPNHYEAARIVNQECTTDTQVEKVGHKILERISAPYLIIKRGEQGMSVFEKGKKVRHIPTVAKEVYDITGAGDTVIATASLALLSGSTIMDAAVLANAAAGIVVGKIGTAAVTAEELLSSLDPE
ncbi:Bifunctional protein HldE [subsurface metagenome]|nr:D-glycero-beta-D-manno-heptose-7-phosphate kinase [bacterium]